MVYVRTSNGSYSFSWELSVGEYVLKDSCSIEGFLESEDKVRNQWPLLTRGGPLCYRGDHATRTGRRPVGDLNLLRNKNV